MKQYIINLLISIDQFVNTVFAGNPDETISSRLGKKVRRGNRSWPYYVCKLLSIVDHRHCEKSIEDDEK